ncbi:MAG: hypothetical protein RML45_14915 [Acetobacteraceae bacterium]|nr:hypothetical protein [Acetobacteraceae bacterium]
MMDWVAVEERLCRCVRYWWAIVSALLGLLPWRGAVAQARHELLRDLAFGARTFGLL